MVNKKRLIDANEAYAIARDSGCHNDFSMSLADLTSLREVLEDCPTVDAVEVVRCKDCKHYERGRCEGNHDICTEEEYWFYVKPDDFCSCGERRADHG